MRPVHLTDLDAATRALLSVPVNQRPETARRLIAGADTADRYRKHLGRAHHWFGTGTLAAAARTISRQRAPVWCDATYCEALTMVLAALASHRTNRER